MILRTTLIFLFFIFCISCSKSEPDEDTKIQIDTFEVIYPTPEATLNTYFEALRNASVETIVSLRWPDDRPFQISQPIVIDSFDIVRRIVLSEEDISELKFTPQPVKGDVQMDIMQHMYDENHMYTYYFRKIDGNWRLYSHHWWDLEKDLIEEDYPVHLHFTPADSDYRIHNQKIIDTDDIHYRLEIDGSGWYFMERQDSVTIYFSMNIILSDSYKLDLSSGFVKINRIDSITTQNVLYVNNLSNKYYPGRGKNIYTDCIEVTSSANFEAGFKIPLSKINHISEVKFITPAFYKCDSTDILFHSRHYDFKVSKVK